MSIFLENEVGLFYGSDSGNTEEVVKMFVDSWNISELEVIEGSDMTVEDYARFDFIIIGLSTWYDGELQSDFEDFFEQFQTIDFSGKVVAMFGLGDQYDYAEYFVDGLGILGEVILANGGHIIGMWPNVDYDFDESKGLFEDGLFYGLPLDSDNQRDMNEPRLAAWMQKLETEIQQMVEA
ncbi:MULTISPECIES: flavodoxin [Reichenbachiella]|uniref:Flavodoxin n=1 Tax=Reichenbachiella agariperforans TaxID=156994 RepID=A0A1M6UNT1_REIAG|nr:MULTISPECIES: flavodoxin [Reichenbachiella]RJE72437.1 flavodoxin [Reichenbachiella sp. MSK19-1]SHK70809.1 flavodoxin I [Reichenbachiella agariperforans]